MSFGENLREILEYRGLQQKELAHEAKIHLRSIEKYLQKDGSIPSADKAVKIAQVLGVTVEYLVTGKNPSDKTAVPIDPEFRKLVQVIKNLPPNKQRIVIKNSLYLAGIL